MSNPNVDTEAMARLLYATECAERRKQIPDEPLYSWEGLPEESRRLNRVLAQALIAARDAQWRDHAATLEAALARAEDIIRSVEEIAGTALVACVLGGGKCESGCCAAIEAAHNRVELIRTTPTA